MFETKEITRKLLAVAVISEVIHGEDKTRWPQLGKSVRDPESSDSKVTIERANKQSKGFSLDGEDIIKNPETVVGKAVTEGIEEAVIDVIEAVTAKGLEACDNIVEAKLTRGGLKECSSIEEGLRYNTEE